MQETLRRLKVVETKIKKLTLQRRELINQARKELTKKRKASPTKAFGLQVRVIQFAESLDGDTFRPYDAYEALSARWPYLTHNKVSACVSRLYKEKVLVREARGMYRLSDENV